MRCAAELVGRLPTKIRLSELVLPGGRLGPIAGQFDEFRVYDFVLDRKEVKGSHHAGADAVAFRKK